MSNNLHQSIIRVACQAEAADPWSTSASTIGRGVLLYNSHVHAEKIYAERAAAERSDASLARSLASESCLTVDPQTLAARPPTARLPDESTCMYGVDLLRQRLRDFCLEERPVRGDGHCQFRSIAFQLYGTDVDHAAVRAAVCEHLASHSRIYTSFVHDESFNDYLARMAAEAWGDHLTLQAFADLSGRPVHLVTSYEARGFIQVAPQTNFPTQDTQAPGTPLLLGFWAEVHYNPIVPLQTPRC
jgi:hypothetical protein